MSKYIYIGRHAEAAFPDSEQRDFDRQLTPKGKKDATAMGRFLFAEDIHADAILSSSAVRALTTAEIISAETRFEKNKITVLDKIYHATVKDILQIISDIDNRHQHALIFGHNPTFSKTAAMICNKHYGTIPQGSIVGIELPIDDWAAISKGIGSEVFFIQP